MAGKFYNNQRVFVEADYDNIIVVDPNKIVNKEGKVEERLVNHEELVIYANLESKIIPRTKLANGVNFDQAVQNIRVASIDGDESLNYNMLKPKGKNFFDTSWSDQITGEGSTESKGANQSQVEIVGQGNTQRKVKRIKNNEDTQLFGITSIDIKQNPSYTPTVKISMVDIQGRALFEQGENSPYSCFMQFPYPMFTLTVKGYYGKAVRYELMLLDFNARFDSGSGNYIIETNFVARSFALLNEIIYDYLNVLPKIGPTQTQTQQLLSGSQNGNPTTKVTSKTSTKGRQMLDEIYTEYKSKGLIDENFPHLSVEEMKFKLDRFERYVMESYGQEDLSVLNDIEDYLNNLQGYRDKIFPKKVDNWFEKYVSESEVFVLNNTENGLLYKFKKELDDQKVLDAIDELNAIILEYNKNLNENATFGTKGKYKINGKEFKSNLECNVKKDNIIKQLESLSSIDFKKTFEYRKGTVGTDSEVQQFRSVIETDFTTTSLVIDASTNQVEQETKPFIFFGETLNNSQSKNSFISILNELENNFNEIRLNIEEKLTDSLSEKVQKSETGLGFNPTIGNVVAVLCASADAFLRLLDDVHFDAWNKRKDPIRLKSIISPDKSFGIDNKNNVESVTVNGKLENSSTVYPWPQYFDKEYDEKGEEMFVAKYPGLPEVANKTQGFRFDLWPEIKFVEDYITAAITRESQPLDTDFNNEVKMAKYVNFNAAEFPLNNKPYSNLSEVPFMYEIYERAFFLSTMNKLSEKNDKNNEIYSVLGDLEVLNIQESASNSPKLSKILKEYKFDESNYRTFLRAISNEGMGINWNQLIRGDYSTNYLESVNEKPYGIYNIDLISDESTTVQGDSNTSEKLTNFLENNTNNKISFLDTYPFTNLNRVKDLLSSDITNIEDAYNTQNSFTFNQTKKVISSFKITDDLLKNKPITYFEWMKNTLKSPKQSINNTDENLFSINTKDDYKEFYNQRDIKKYYLTEGKVLYGNEYSNNYNLSDEQTTSLLNTPYFVNSILDGVNKEKEGVENPYVTLSYLLLNSLPLSALHQKVKTFENDLTSDGNYMFAILSKYSSIHKIPYLWILKYGSIWYRYKNYITTGNDILNDVWGPVDYKKMYDPDGSSDSKIYQISIDDVNVNYKLKNDTINNILQTENTAIKSGFYPKMINDLYYLFTKRDVFDNYTTQEIQNKLSDYNIKVKKSTEPNYINLSNFSGSVSTQEFNVYLDLDNNLDFENNTNKKLLIPSGGYLNKSQSNFEFFNGLNLTTNLSDNTSYFNGSARCLWGSPNYGFFNDELIKKPKPNQYIKLKNKVSSGSFGLSSDQEEYEYIDDLFSVFSIDILDEFERHFLNFTKRKEDIKDLVQNPQSNKINFFNTENKSYKISVFDILEKIFVVDNGSTTEDLANQQTLNLKDFYGLLFENDIILKIGNAGEYDRKVFLSLSDNLKPVDSIDFGVFSGYEDEEADLSFFLNIGSIGNLEYETKCISFFEDLNIEYNKSNVESLSKIIKVYGSEKLNYEGDNFIGDFKDKYEKFLMGQDTFKSDILNHVFINLNRKLPSVTITDETKRSRVDGNIGKNEQYYTFKALNDRWIAGQDFRNRTIYEDFLFLDKSMKPIGNDILIDVVRFRGELNKTNANVSLYNLIGILLDQNKFTMMPAPSYTNFYGRNTRVKNSEPLPEDIGNNIFGTFLEVDVNDTKPKILAIYVGNVSETTDQKNNTNYVFNDDSFDLKKSQLNPLKDNLDGITDYSSRNKVVGFTVDFGTRNQGVFKNISIDMSQHKATSLSFKVQEDMANQFGGQEVSQQSQSLYNYYKSMSYNCTVEGFGNAMIQPTMYFHLANVPMFHGTYLIMDVTHSINNNNFSTSFNGVRLPVYVSQVPDKLVASINRDLVKKYRDSIKNIQSQSSTNTDQQVDSQTGVTNNNTSQNTPTVSSNCVNITKYEQLPFVDPSQPETDLTQNEFLQMIKNKTDNVDLQNYLFVIGSNENTSGVIEKNIFNIRTDRLWGGTLSQVFTGQYCSTVNGGYISYAKLDSVEDGIDFMVSKYTQIMSPNILQLYFRDTILDEPTRRATALADIWISSWMYDFMSGLNQIELQNKVDEILDSGDQFVTDLYGYMKSEFKKQYT